MLDSIDSDSFFVLIVKVNPTTSISYTGSGESSNTVSLFILVTMALNIQAQQPSEERSPLLVFRGNGDSPANFLKLVDGRLLNRPDVVGHARMIAFMKFVSPYVGNEVYH